MPLVAMVQDLLLSQATEVAAEVDVQGEDAKRQDVA